MKRILTLLLTSSLLMPALAVPARAESSTEDTAPETAADTLSEELGLETETIPADSMNPDQNCVSLLNHLIIQSYAIENAQDSRLYLEGVYTQIADNINPQALDAETQAQLDQFLEVLDSLRMLKGRREKLSYIYQYNQARGMRSAVDDPAALLSHAHSFDLKDIALSGPCLSPYSQDSYTAVQNSVELQYLQSGMTLGEEELQRLMEARDNLSAFLKDFVKNKNLPEESVLSEEAAVSLAAAVTAAGTEEKIQFLEENNGIYSEYPDFWELSAKAYFEAGDYQNCRTAIESFIAKRIPVFLKDRSLAALIPYGIVSLAETVSVNDIRVKETAALAEHLIRNTSMDDWASRYLAAQAYLDISRASSNVYMKTRYLNNAYIIIKSVTGALAGEQRNRNDTYLADIVKEAEPAGASAAVKKEVRDFNTLLKEDRKTALPPISEALLLSADLLRALSEKAGSDVNAVSPDQILYPDDTPLFLNLYADRIYRNSSEEVTPAEISFDKKKITVPAEYMADDYVLKTVTAYGTDTYTFEDWTIDKITRNDKNDVSTFMAELTSEKNRHFKFEENMTVTIELTPTGIVPAEPVTVRYRTVPAKVFFFFDTVKLEKIQ